MSTEKIQNAFILRIAPGLVDKLPEALETNQVIIGWAMAEGLLDESLDWNQFRRIISNTYYSEERTMHRAGGAAGHLWRFLRDMKTDDLVVVPYGQGFYVARITGAASYDPANIENDSAYRLPVEWLNNKQPMPRQIARAALQSRMSTQGTTANASDLLDEIKECLRVAARREAPTFQNDLKKRLVREVLSEIRDGRIEDFKFERLIKTLLLGLGAVDCEIVARNSDKGADLIADFRLAGVFQTRVAVQAKHWQPEPPVDASVVQQLIDGIEAEQTDLGMVVTSGTISEAASQAARNYFDDKGVRIELVDGEQLATLIVERGIGASWSQMT